MRKGPSLHPPAHWQRCPGLRRGVHQRTNALCAMRPQIMSFGGASMYLQFCIFLLIMKGKVPTFSAFDKLSAVVCLPYKASGFLISAIATVCVDG